MHQVFLTNRRGRGPEMAREGSLLPVYGMVRWGGLPGVPQLGRVMLRSEEGGRRCSGELNHYPG